MKITDIASLFVSLAGLTLIVVACFTLSLTAGLVAAGVAGLLVGEFAFRPRVRR